MRISVIGTGYLGAVHAACMADIGHEVLGVDVDPGKVAALAAGRPPFFEPGFADLLARTLRSGRLRFSQSLEDAARHGRVHFVCVGTPQRTDSPAADLRYVNAAVEGLVPHLRGPAVLVGKSTVPVGTAAGLQSRLAGLAQAGADVQLAWNPEFLREGFAVADTLAPDRLVVGATSRSADEALRQVYAPMLAAGVPYISTDLSTAELVKVAANAFLATKISFINAVAEVCSATGADVVTLADAMGHDNRIGRRFLNAGLGFGGGCLPKDIRAFLARADELGFGEAVSFLRQVDEINMRQRQRVVDLTRDMLDGFLSGRKVAVLGAAFKPDSDDVRDSPALAVAAGLHVQGAEVRVHDPVAIQNARALLPVLDYEDDVETVVEGADVVLHLTDWADYRRLDPRVLRDLVASPRLLDARNALDLNRWRVAGWNVRSLGRPEAGRPDCLPNDEWAAPGWGYVIPAPRPGAAPRSGAHPGHVDLTASPPASQRVVPQTSKRHPKASLQPERRQ